MLTVRRLLVALCALALLTASVVPAAIGAAPTDSGAATASKKKGKRCKKGFKPKTVTKKGKKVRVCRKAKKPAPKPGPTPGPVGIFEAPGQKLEGEAAKPFLQKYLLNSTFTDCPTGWPSCGGFEDRYSHTADGTFYKCWLRPTSGSDVKSVGEYRVDNARVEPDGSWIFNETVYWYGNYANFEWQVTANGVVNGAYQSSPSEAPEAIGPLQYVSGARDCSY